MYAQFFSVCQQQACFCCVCVYVDLSVGGAAVSTDDGVHNKKKRRRKRKNWRQGEKIEGGRGRLKQRETESQTERWFRSTRSTQL